MKKWIALLLALLLAIPGMGEEAIPEAEARVLEACQLALEYLRDSCGLTEEETALLTPVVVLLGEEDALASQPVDYERAWWQITFTLPGLADDGVIAVTVEGESRYTYLDYGNPDGFYLAFQRWRQWQQRYDAAQRALTEWQQRLGDPLFWDYREKAAFYQQYGVAPDAAGEDTALSCDLPDEEDIGYEKACTAALAALTEHLGAEAEELAALKMGAAFTSAFWHPWGERAWILHFYGPEASVAAPDRRYTAFVLSPLGEAVTVMGFAGDEEAYWSVLDEE
ncbi:MAG: hypothetical protein E7324_03280 [Clostridiales bacterium]|nr:hypothetical protein [Clostridiales bacterium]